MSLAPVIDLAPARERGQRRHAHDTHRVRPAAPEPECPLDAQLRQIHDAFPAIAPRSQS